MGLVSDEASITHYPFPRRHQNGSPGHLSDVFIHASWTAATSTRNLEPSIHQAIVDYTQDLKFAFWPPSAPLLGQDRDKKWIASTFITGSWSTQTRPKITAIIEFYIYSYLPTTAKIPATNWHSGIPSGVDVALKRDAHIFS
jgi:hypothetical protein